jgi:RNA polymerase sigma-70 factor, ECF subfamily
LVDAADVRRACRCDRYEEISGPVYGLAVRIVRDRAQAEEVAQEALMEVWRHASRFDPSRGSARAWVMTIAHRRAVDRMRSEHTSMERSERDARASVRLSPEQDVAEAVEGRLERQRLRGCLDGLSELQSESVVLAYYGGYTYRQVAELLAAPLGTVKTRLRDGLIRLRDCLGVGR